MHREPCLHSDDVELFLATVVPLLKPGRDLIWILAGRTESNLTKLKRILDHSVRKDAKIKSRLHHENFYDCYNAKPNFAKSMVGFVREKR